MGGGCPFGKGCEIDSPSCRKCQWFYRTGTGTFFWCRHPERANEMTTTKAAEFEKKPSGTPGRKYLKGQTGKKRGRPAKKAENKPISGRKTKKQ